MDTINMGAGYPMETQRFRFFNRTGATLYKGQFAMMDFLRTQTSYTTRIGTSKGEGDCPFDNLTPVTQLGYNAGYGIVICEDDQIANNEAGWCVIMSPDVQAHILDSDVATTDVDIGDAVAILVSESATAAQGWATSTTPRAIGIAHEDDAATSADTDRLFDASVHRRRIMFDGRPLIGFSDT